MSVVNKPYTFSPNTTMSSSQMNANFDTLYNEINGNLSAANLASNAVTTAKITDSNVTTAKVADSAITTAKINDGAVTPDKRSGGFKVGSFTRPGSTGNYSVTGVGFTPKLVRFTYLVGSSGVRASSGMGVMDASGNQHSWFASGETGSFARNSSTSHCYYIGSSSSATPDNSAQFVSMDADGFTINVTASGGSVNVGWEAIA